MTPFKGVKHSVQTNAALLDDAWCDFLLEHDVHVGVSIDGRGTAPPPPGVPGAAGAGFWRSAATVPPTAAAPTASPAPPQASSARLEVPLPDASAVAPLPL